MYRCQDCGRKFDRPIVTEECHALDAPPYEPKTVCPYCASAGIQPIEVHHCRCCGARLPEGKREYCDRACRNRGEKLWRLERRRRKKRESDPLGHLVAAIEHYNREHGTAYSYGQYVGLVLGQKERG